MNLDSIFLNEGPVADMGSIVRPIYRVNIDSIDGKKEGHSMNCIFTGDNTLYEYPDGSYIYRAVSVNKIYKGIIVKK